MRGDWISQAREYDTVDRAALHKAKLALAMEDALKYARKIRNPAKREYALAYAAFRFGNASYAEPERCAERLSFMGAQAVRHQMEAIYRSHFEA